MANGPTPRCNTQRQRLRTKRGFEHRVKRSHREGRRRRHRQRSGALGAASGGEQNQRNDEHLKRGSTCAEPATSFQHHSTGVDRSVRAASRAAKPSRAVDACCYRHRPTHGPAQSPALGAPGEQPPRSSVDGQTDGGRSTSPHSPPQQRSPVRLSTCVPLRYDLSLPARMSGMFVGPAEGTHHGR